MPNGQTPEAYTTPLRDEEIDVDAGCVDTSDHVFFTRNRLALRLETPDGKVFLFALHRDAQRELRERLA